MNRVVKFTSQLQDGRQLFLLGKRKKKIEISSSLCLRPEFRNFRGRADAGDESFWLEPVPPPLPPSLPRWWEEFDRWHPIRRHRCRSFLSISILEFLEHGNATTWLAEKVCPLSNRPHVFQSFGINRFSLVMAADKLRARHFIDLFLSYEKERGEKKS